MAQDDTVFAFTNEHVKYVEQYGAGCRDCADENGVCPHSGLPCGKSQKAIQYVLDAVEHGVKNGFVLSPVRNSRSG